MKLWKSKIILQYKSILSMDRCTRCHISQPDMLLPSHRSGTVIVCASSCGFIVSCKINHLLNAVRCQQNKKLNIINIVIPDSD